MRLIFPAVMGCFGVFLLFAAVYRYEEDKADLAPLNRVVATVSSIGPDGSLKLKYTVGSTNYEIERSIGVNCFPRIKAGDKVTLLYETPRPDSATVKHWSEIYADSAVAGGFGVVAIFLAVMVFMMVGTGSVKGHAPVAAAVVTTLDHAIDLRSTWKEFTTTMVIVAGTLVVAFLLYRYPYFLWRPWLSYPVAAVVALLGVGMFWAAFSTKSLRIHADQDGVGIKDSDGSRTFSWTDVAALKRETLTRKREDDGIDELGHYFYLLDGSGGTLLKLNEDEPMEPVPDWMLLRAFIRGRTGLPVKEETRNVALLDSNVI
jgi:hypothetical protein